jgi:hypothetical protein
MAVRLPFKPAGNSKNKIKKYGQNKMINAAT